MLTNCRILSVQVPGGQAARGGPGSAASSPSIVVVGECLAIPLAASEVPGTQLHDWRVAVKGEP